MNSTGTFAIAAAMCLGSAAGSASAASFTLLHSFSGKADGAYPYAGLAPHGGLLYGAAGEGASRACHDGCGAMFSIDPRSGSLVVTHGFTGKPDGAYPRATPTFVGHELYQNSDNGGTADLGAIQALDVSTGAFSRVFSFGTTAPSGSVPDGALDLVGKDFWGVTPYRGDVPQCPAVGCGTAYAIDAATGALDFLYDFANGASGMMPVGALVGPLGASAAPGPLYGVTNGGSDDDGSIFSLATDGSGPVVVHAFQGGGTGSHPLAGMTAYGGLLYGTASSGGTGDGVAYSFDPSTGDYEVLHAFAGGAADGAVPSSALTVRDGMLYGVTSAGGASNAGTVYSLDPSTGVVSVVHAFSGADGSFPSAALAVMGGALYGTTVEGGTSGLGTVFSVVP